MTNTPPLEQTISDEREGHIRTNYVHAASIVLPRARWPLGQTVRKKKGSQWHGTIVGFYSTSLTPIGYAVESATEKGSVQIYPEAALEEWAP